jgi:D-glycero-D-manno-heptose 1,7-bisphosphate phosphatase
MLVAFDADNTLIQTKSGETFINDPLDQKPTEGSIELVASIKRQGASIYIATNQGGIERGHKTLQNGIIEQRYTLQLFPQITAVCMADNYYTSYFWYIDRRGEQKVRGPIGIKARKPDAGMLMYLEEKLVLNDADRPWMIGDSTEDDGAADNAGWDYLHISEAIALGKIPD